MKKLQKILPFLSQISSLRGLFVFGLIVSVGVLCIVHQQANAITSISQSYTTKQPLSLGTIVSLQKDTTDQIAASTFDTSDSIIGVVIDSDNSLLSLTSGQQNQAQVATSGSVQVLVSDINGPVKEGDHITASTISGVGMKATSNIRVVGVAQADLKGTKQTYKDKDGKDQSVNIGDVPVLVNVAYYFKEPDKTIVPSALQNVANAVAGHEVNALPIFISVAIFFIMLIVVASMIYSMIRSSIISVGRNPMSQSAVYRDLMQMSVLVLVIVGAAIAAIFMVLTKL